MIDRNWKCDIQCFSLLAVIICVVICVALFEERLGCDFAKQHDTDAITRARKLVVSTEAREEGKGTVLAVAVVGRLGHCLLYEERTPSDARYVKGVLRLTSAKYTPLPNMYPVTGASGGAMRSP